jgi:hypothetical protein
MAAFMHRLGIALEPYIEFVDQNPGPVDIQASADNYVCQSPAFTLVPGDAPRRAFVHGLVWGLVDAAVVWNADIWYSTDFGVTWFFASNFIPFNGTSAAGATQGSTFARVDLDGGTTMPNYYVFAIRVRESADGPNGTGNFTDLACHLMVEIGNRNGGFAPFDSRTRRGDGGLLRGNRKP